MKETLKSECEVANNWFTKIFENFNSNLNSAKENTVKTQYAKNCDTLHRGFYCPSIFIEHLAGNVSRGKLTEKKPKGSYFEYGFDANNRLIYSYNFQKTRLVTSFFYECIIHQNNVSYSVFCKHEAEKYNPIYCSKCCYDDINRITEYNLYWISPKEHKICILDKECYAYKKDVITVSIYSYSDKFMNLKSSYQTRSYNFHFDENGNMLYYTSSDGRRFELNPKAINPFQQNY